MRHSLLCVLVLTTAATLHAATPATQPASIGPMLKLPSYGISVPIPKGWTRLRENGEEMIMTAAKIDEVHANVLGVLQVNITAKEHSNLQQYTHELAVHLHGKVAMTTGKLGGIDAVEIRVPPPSTPPKANDPAQVVAVLVAERRGFYYLLFFLTPSGTGSLDDFNAVADGIIWSDFVEPSDVLSGRPIAPPSALFTLFDSNVMFMLPDPFRPGDTNKTQMIFRTTDLTTHKPEVTLTIDRAPLTRMLPLAQLETVLTDSGSKVGWTVKPTWTNNSKSTIGYSSVITRTGQHDGQPLGPTQDLIYIIGDGTFTVFEFDYPSAAVATKYAKQMDAIVKSFSTIHTTSGRGRAG